MRIRLIMLLVSFIILSMFLTGCDSSLDVKGRVVEWVDAPNTEKGSVYTVNVDIVNVSGNRTSIVHINESPPKGYNLQPVPSANISFYYEFRGKYYPVRGRYPTPEENYLTSDSKGNFEEFWVVGPGNYNMKIIAQKDGYYPVERIFPFHGGLPGTFDFTVVLVRKPE